MNQLSNKEKSNYAIKLGWVSIFGNIGLFVLKYAAGIVSGSVALVADAWHTLGDTLSSIILIIGIKISNKPADEEHPFGHGRAEWVASLLIGVFLIIVGVSFVKESIERLIDHQDFHYGRLAWIATIVSIISKELIAQLAFRGARKTGLSSLRADGWHHRTDALSSILVLIGLFIGNKIWWIDGVLGILVSVLIFVAAWEILKENISSILGEKPDEKTIREIYRITELNCQKDIDLHLIKMHIYGQHKELTAHISLPGNMKLETAHNIATSIESMVWDELGILATIHVDSLPVEEK